MKKIVFAIVIGLVTFTSCKKDYACSCSAGGYTWSETYSNVTKSDAEGKCNAKETSSQLADPDAECSLK